MNKVRVREQVFHSMIQFFVLDVLLSRVVAVSTDPAPDSAFAPSFFGRPAGQLPSSPCTMSCVSRQAKIIHPFLSAFSSPIPWRRGWLFENPHPFLTPSL